MLSPLAPLVDNNPYAAHFTRSVVVVRDGSIDTSNLSNLKAPSYSYYPFDSSENDLGRRESRLYSCSQGPIRLQALFTTTISVPFPRIFIPCPHQLPTSRRAAASATFHRWHRPTKTLDAFQDCCEQLARQRWPAPDFNADAMGERGQGIGATEFLGHVMILRPAFTRV